MNIKGENYYVGIWYLEVPRGAFSMKRGGNILVTVWREPDQKPTDWHFEYRIRTYVDSKVFGSDDEKRGRSGIIEKHTELAVIGKTQGLMEGFAKTCSKVSGNKKSDLFYVELRCMGAEAVERLHKNPPPFMQMKTVPENATDQELRDLGFSDDQIKQLHAARSR